MGVKGLWWFLVNHCEQNPHIFRQYDLVKEAARSEDGLTLIMDFYPFEYWIINQVHRDILSEQSETNPWITVSGGEYNFFGDYAVKLVKALAQCNIKLVIVTNAGRCSSTGQMDFKYARWLQTDLRDMKKVQDVLQLIDESEQSELLKPHRESKSPTLLPLEVAERLRQAGCEILCSLDGEADPFIAKLRNERRAFAILSNDSDFLLFENCRYINLDEHFDTSGTLAAFLSKNTDKVEELLVKCVFSQDVYEALDLPCVDAAADLSFVLGNDVSKQFPDLYKRLNLLRFSVKGVASRISRFGPLTKNNMFKGVFNDPNIKEAHRLTHELYKNELSSIPEHDDNGDGDNENKEARKVINEEVLHGRIAGSCLPISRGFYWQDAKIVETNDDVSSMYSSEAACLPLRLICYKMLITNPDKDEIVEYRPLKTSQLTERVAFSLNEATEKIPLLATLPKIHQLGDLNRQARLDLFDRIINRSFTTEEETEFKSPADKVYSRWESWPLAFRIYVCRLIWLANSDGKNLQLTRSEMESVIVSVLGPAFFDNATEMGIKAACKPTRRSLTVGSFVQVAYRYLYSYIAKMLNLADEPNAILPLPSSFFSGSLFTAVFCHRQDDKSESEARAHIRRMRDEILEKHSDAIETVLAPLS